MYVAMNRFNIVSGCEDEFEAIWKGRESHLTNVRGFKRFNLIKGTASEKTTLYISHSIWESEELFKHWTKSENFRLAHKNAGNNSHLYEGHPQFEGFEIVL